ncbi:protein CYP659A1 [Aspergillus nidulans FGSC A4]|uniref:Cytochrome P450, putative (Eurofung) n=1 Tax=Emericella nidulans (strain FGSC A4 / ATCC 38163 / CBS 112.46 / NRRL 194 / M139) TaxID=227321 RepID=C8VHU2_EMENI|nr:protein CYP659A1 [Aspergillus nidulans FGSC A4]CBF82894.1 TPA: cytochrome P450, putative (Eurofung) [Aspergillus nidulans FGSC A4]
MDILDVASSELYTLVRSLVTSPVCQGVLFSLLTWRLWRFTISPTLQPEDPKEAPYWIPCINQLGNTREPFALTLAGKTMYIIADPKDAAELIRNSHSLSTLTTELYTRMGIPQAVIERLFTVYPDAPFNARSNARPVHATDAMIEMYRAHLSPGAQLDEFLERDVTKRILNAFAKIPGLFNKGIVGAYYGDLIFSLNPGFIAQFMVWEKVNWKLLFGLPSFLSGDMLAARKGLVDGFVAYFALPRAERGHENYWVKGVEDSLRWLNVSNEDIARIFMLQTWAILGNMYKMTFWLVAHILHDAALVNAITAEVRPAIEIDHHYLSEQCPKLDSLFSEVLRLTLTAPMARDVSETTTVGGRRLREGNRVLVLYRQLHLDRATWGPTPQTLQPDRFLIDSGLKSSIAYRPWGAGKHICPGRFLARSAVFTFVAYLLAGFEVRLRETGTGKSTRSAFPMADMSRPSPGIANIADGEDVLISVIRRDRSS